MIRPENTASRSAERGEAPEKQHQQKADEKIQAHHLANCFKAGHDGVSVRANGDQSTISAKLCGLVAEALVVFADPRACQDANKITIEVSEDLSARPTELVKRCTTIDEATSHGAPTVDSLLTTLVEDCSVVLNCPGS